MEFLQKIKETFFSVFLITFTGLFLGLTIVPLHDLLIPFVVGSGLVILGLSIFLTGTDIGLVPVGEKLGEIVSGKKNVLLLILLGLTVGFCVTFAEPDVNVLCSQVTAINPNVDPLVLKFLIAVGLAVFLASGLLCILKKLKLNYVFICLYLAILLLVCFVGESMSSIAFDASGSTTGPLAVPFIIALGIGISRTTKKGDVQGFGLTGIASVGPILFVLLSKFIFTENHNSSISIKNEMEIHGLSRIFSSQIFSTAKGFLPLVILIVILQIFLVKFPKIKFKNIVLGIVYSFIGIVIFLTGAEYGFIPAGRVIGRSLFETQPWYLTSAIAFIIGLFTVTSEPAVWVLTSQVEDVTNGSIGKRTVMFFLCFGVSVAVMLASLRIYFEINYLFFIFGAVLVSLFLSLFSPPLFTSLAFDSGGVASGPMCSSFILSFIIGGSSSAQASFGVIGLVAMAPIISIQILGIIFERKRLKALSNATEGVI